MVVKQDYRTEYQSENSRWPCNSIPQPFHHYRKLVLQYRFYFQRFIISLCVVNKQSDNVEHAAKPRNNKKNVNGF